jgi:glycosyltransferase involved in cell wall biosynthesis
MPDYLRLADIVVMPSSTEALALLYLETMATGKVLIASDIVAARRVVTHEVTGLLHPVGDVGALAELTLAAAADADMRARLGAAARERIASFGLPAVIERYEHALWGIAT